MYVAVKGGEAAIRNAHRLLDDRRRGDRAVPALGLDQIVEQLALAVDRVMAEGSLYDRELAALAVKQARGDMIEAIFLVRAYRTTLPRFGYSLPVDTAAMRVERRVSATYKDLPGGQLLGPTFDYTHRLLDPELANDQATDAPDRRDAPQEPMPRVSDILAAKASSRKMERSQAATAPATSRASRWNFRSSGIRACRRWRAATKVSCWRSPIPHSAAMRVRIPLSAKSASARSSSNWKSLNWISLSRSGASR